MLLQNCGVYAITLEKTIDENTITPFSGMEKNLCCQDYTMPTAK